VGCQTCLYFVEAQEAGQREGIPAVVLVGILADEAIAAGIANDDLLDVRLKELEIQRARLDSSSMRRLTVAGMAWTCLRRCRGSVGKRQ